MKLKIALKKLTIALLPLFVFLTISLVTGASAACDDESGGAPHKCYGFDAWIKS